jgi:hypothetical protein
MLLMLNNTLFKAALDPVMPLAFRIEHNHEEQRLELWHGDERVMFGVSWHGYECKIDGKTGKLLAIPPKSSSVRAVCGSTHVDISF